MINQRCDKTYYDGKKFSNRKIIILLLYVDDMLIVGLNKNEIQSLKRQLSKSFAMKDLGPKKHVHGMRSIREI